MKLKRLELANFRGIEELTLDLEDQINLFVGTNGSGKSTVLDAVVTSLSWLVNRIQRETASGKPITLTSIKNGEDFASITAILVERDHPYTWKLVRQQSGSEVAEKSELSEVTNLASMYAHIRREESSLPVIAYYPINRVVGNITPDVNSREGVNIFDVYENSLGGQTNYQAFFEWFRLQDDIVNEKVSSRTNWMIANKIWIKRRVKKLTDSLEKMISTSDDRSMFFKDMQLRFNRDDFIYEDPRYLFHELSDMIRFVSYDSRNNEQSILFEQIDYMLHRMSQLSGSRRDDLIEFNDYPTKIVAQIIDLLEERSIDFKTSDSRLNTINFVWDALLFSVLLSLWWMSNRGKKNLEYLFRSNFPVVRDHLLFQNNRDRFLHELEQLIKRDAERFVNAKRNHGRELFFVTRTIENLIEGYSNLRVRRTPRPHMLIDKFGKEINLDQLSDGEKNLIAMVGDISRRLTMANPQLRDPLNGNGIIIIDEVDLHLHPGWQRLMIPKLTELFPNCQFIISTHSPQVISHARPESIFLLYSNQNGITCSKPAQSYGMNTDRILEDILGVTSRPEYEQKKIESIYTHIQKGEIEAAIEIIRELMGEIGDDPELLKAQTLIKRRSIIGK